jgi:hypothetical protein
LECGGKRSATPLWIGLVKTGHPQRRRRFALPPHSKSLQEKVVGNHSLNLHWLIIQHSWREAGSPRCIFCGAN